jgi:hypothetical protein
VNAGYAELQRDRPSWEEWTTERVLWDRTLADGAGWIVDELTK